MAFYVLNSTNNLADELSHAIQSLKSKIRFCEKCHGISEDVLCQICSDPRRDSTSICVVENPADIYTFEKTNIFKGLYHVLGGVLSPLDGIGPDDLNINSLIERVNTDDEILVATNATIEGEATCLYLANILEKESVKVTRLARGLPIGGDLEFAYAPREGRAGHGIDQRYRIGYRPRSRRTRLRRHAERVRRSGRDRNHTGGHRAAT